MSIGRIKVRKYAPAMAGEGEVGIHPRGTAHQEWALVEGAAVVTALAGVVELELRAVELALEAAMEAQA